MTAAIYARKSTEQNGADADARSVPRQIENARAFAALNGWIVDEAHIYSDDAVSGADTRRLVQRQRLLDTIRRGAPFNVLIMRDASRFSRRDGDEAFAELKAIVRAGVAVWFYQDGTQFTYGDMGSNLIGFVKAEMNAEWRRQIAKWTTEAMRRKAERGHVTGGRLFGYDNIRVDGHVERVINEAEAGVVRRIFEMCARGDGRITIAKTLNAEGALSPRSQQGRPRAWADSSVREVLYRTTYRGEVIWNKSKKRDTSGEVKQVARPESEWLRSKVPQLRIVSDSLWNAAHARLAEAHANYLQVTGGRLWGKPKNGTASRYLLTGLSRCGCCGGSFEPEPRWHGRRRVVVYRCASYKRRGTTVCTNSLSVRLDAMESAVVNAFEPLLTPEFIETIIRKVMVRAVRSGTDVEEATATVRTQIGEVRRELGRLVEALAQTGMSATVTRAIKDREARLNHLERELAALEGREQVSRAEVGQGRDDRASEGR